MIRFVWRKNIFLQHHFKRKSSFVASQIDLKKLSTKHLGSFSFDIIRLCEQNKELYESYKCRIIKDIDLLDGKDCYRILKSLEINNKINEEEELLKYILKRMCIESCRYSIKEICDICFLCSKLNIIYIPLFASLSIVFINKINLASPEHLTIMCLCYSKIQIKDVNLFNRISVAALNILYMYDIENLINLLLSYIYIDIPADLLLHSSIPIFIKNEKKLDSNSLNKLAYVYSNYKYKSHDINCLLKNKLPLYICSLNNIQLSELIISLDRLYIKHYPIYKYYTNVNLICLDFPLAIKVIHVISQLDDISLELKYDEIFLCINNFLAIHGKNIRSGEMEHKKNNDTKIKKNDDTKIKKTDDTKIKKNDDMKIKTYDNMKIKKNDDMKIKTYDDIKIKTYDDIKIKTYDDMVRLYYMSYGLTEQYKKSVKRNNIFCDNHTNEDSDLPEDFHHTIKNRNNNFSYLEFNKDKVLEQYSLCSSLKIKNINNNEYDVVPHCDNINNVNSMKRYYFEYNMKRKLDNNSLCFLYTDIFESIYNLLINNNNNIYEYDEKLKIYMNYICKEIVYLKNNLNINCLSRIFNTIGKMPIIWNLTFLPLDLIKDTFFIFYINEETHFYEELLESYFEIYCKCDNIEYNTIILYNIINLFLLNNNKKYYFQFEKCLEHYSKILGRKSIEEEYMKEECIIIYNYIEYNFKNINLWSKRKHKTNDKNENINNNNVIDSVDEVLSQSCSSYNLEKTINVNNKLLTLELYNIIEQFNKNIKINHKEEIYFIPVVEYENYIAYVFLQPEDYYYSSSEKNYLSILEDKMGYLTMKSLKNNINDKNKKYSECDKEDILPLDWKYNSSLILINNVLYNSYKTFYNDTFFIKSNALVKIYFLLIKGYNIIAIPFYIWRNMSYEEKQKQVQLMRKQIINS
ncbi:conserved Plasmodium protein, unknown function [Plasmodium sp. gorilla clade G2]|uniref:conserved Plasmodium protein, unknown function n=1 Tax=Plasmodium sp. gorilla clade G2 TaxID=880535 RepID=UPI000D225B58|nr:conserved Plasmodium protein, unknown function [Plasmodium sp. gorilla clade G2]SOV14635.1 conserved Plasmodium protein, unknown function [Plasmodium sp. gorilla clade G2]